MYGAGKGIGIVWLELMVGLFNATLVAAIFA